MVNQNSNQAKRLIAKIAASVILCLFSLSLNLDYGWAQTPDGIGLVVASPDGSRLAVSGTNGLLRIVNADTGADLIVMSGLVGTIADIDWNPDGTRLASSHPGEGVIRFWNTSNGSIISTNSVPHVVGLGWSSNGLYIAADRLYDTSSDLVIFNAATFSQICSIAFGSVIFSLDWSPNASILAVASGQGAYTVDIPSSCTRTSLGAISTVGNAAISIAYKPDATQIAIGGNSGQIRIYNSVTGQIITSFQRHANYINALEWSSNGRYLVSAGEGIGESVFVTDLINGSVVGSYPLMQAGRVGTLAVAFSADGTRLYYGDGTTVYNVPVLTVATPTPTPTPTHTPTPIPRSTLNVTVSLGVRAVVGQIFSVVLSQAGTIRRDTVAVAASDGVLTLTDVVQGQYDVWVKHPQTLAAAQSVNVNSATVAVNLGTLRLGDASDSNQVNITDFSILAANFGQAGAPRPTGGVIPVPPPSAPLPPELSSARMSLSRSRGRLRVNDIFSVTVRVGNASSSASQGIVISQLDGSEVHLTFDPARLRVESVNGLTAGAAFTSVLQSAYNNTTGTIDFAAGSLDSPIQSEFDLVTIRFRALASTGTGTTAIQASTAPNRQNLLTLRGAEGAPTLTPLNVTVAP